MRDLDRKLESIADRIEIAALWGEFTDAVMMRDYDRLASLFADDGVWRIPEAHVEFRGRREIRAGSERLQGAWEFFVQTVHPGAIELDGDTASGRVYVQELGRMRDGRSGLNYSLYRDCYRRTSDGWKFAERVYEVRYLDTAPLAGSGWSPGSGSERDVVAALEVEVELESEGEGEGEMEAS
ncbi:nuclear transport factor 2 family protein [Embleya sp. NPDC055664]|uniref:nuclear transport factor 2 family protein n=1 Tax=Embleya sp. NPDC059237 TaxID=3346784 RepID=UPI0036C3650A